MYNAENIQMIFVILFGQIHSDLNWNQTYWTKSTYSMEDRVPVKVDSLYRRVLRKKARAYHGE